MVPYRREIGVMRESRTEQTMVFPWNPTDTWREHTAVQLRWFATLIWGIGLQKPRLHHPCIVNLKEAWSLGERLSEHQQEAFVAEMITSLQIE